jgi:hypothetical protein
MPSSAKRIRQKANEPNEKTKEMQSTDSRHKRTLANTREIFIKENAIIHLLMKGIKGKEHVIQLNDGAGDVDPEPIKLNLRSGEEQTISLRIVNLGEPSDMSITPSESIRGVVQLQKTGYYVVLEETVPISVRMPKSAEVVRGELNIKSGQRETSVLVQMVNADPSSSNSSIEGPEEVKKHSPDASEEDFEEKRPSRKPAHITSRFSPARPAQEEDYEAKQESQDDDKEEDESSVDDERPNGRRRANGGLEIDDLFKMGYERPDVEREEPFVEKTPRNEHAASYQVSTEINRRSQAASRDRYYKSEENTYWRESQEGDHPGYADYGGYRADMYDAARYDPDRDEPGDKYGAEEFFRRNFNFRGGANRPIAPAIMIIALVLLLYATFIHAKLPLFPGALACSILIVTLIIWVAANLIKA